MAMNIQDPLERLQVVSEEIHRHFTTAEFFVMNKLMNFMGSLPRCIADPIYIDFTCGLLLGLTASKTASISLSTLPGPKEQLVMNGNPINQIVFSVPPTIDLHAFCTLLSYHDRVTVTLTVDANLFSEAQCNAMLEAFNEDLNAIVASVHDSEAAFSLCWSRMANTVVQTNKRTINAYSWRTSPMSASLSIVMSGTMSVFSAARCANTLESLADWIAAL